MPHLAPLALLLALGTPLLASTHVTHAKPVPRHVAASHHAVTGHAAPAHAAKPVRASEGRRHATSADFAEALPPQARHNRGAQVAQPAAMPRETRGRRAKLERVSRRERERSPRRALRLDFAANRLRTVVSVIRATAEHPRLVDLPTAAAEPMILPQQYDARGRLMIPAALVGSHAILLHQNEMAEADGLGRVQNDADLEGMRERGMLVSLPIGSGLGVDDRLPVNRRFSRPWTASFLNDLARAHYAHFHTPLQVNSAVRTVEFQQHLMHINGNAAPADGDTASPHLTGQAIDLAKRGMPLAEIAWMRGYLLPLIEEGKIDVEEEFQQSCFHISVYRRYAAATESPYRVAARDGSSAMESMLR